ncbi:MAG: hypothetical protein ACRDTU_09775 [Micromonosporaceae bacterium]
MSLLVRLVYQDHSTIRQYSDSPDGELLALAQRMRDTSEVMRIIEQDQDAMFNRIQQGMVREHLRQVLSESDLPPAEADAARKLLDAVEEVYETGGYVMILGE